MSRRAAPVAKILQIGPDLRIPCRNVYPIYANGIPTDHPREEYRLAFRSLVVESAIVTQLRLMLDSDFTHYDFYVHGPRVVDVGRTVLLPLGLPTQDFFREREGPSLIDIGIWDAYGLYRISGNLKCYGPRETWDQPIGPIIPGTRSRERCELPEVPQEYRGTSPFIEQLSNYSSAGTEDLPVFFGTQSIGDAPVLDTDENAVGPQGPRRKIIIDEEH